MLDSGRQLPLAESPVGAVRLSRLAFAAIVALAAAGPARAQTLVPPDELSRTIIIQEVSQQGDRVAGVIANLSDRPIRDVRLQVVFSWLWADEHRQGTEDPGFAATEIIHAEIPPRGHVTFGYKYPSADTTRRDGTFLVDAKIVGYRVVEPRTVPR
jgi:hypothetical protein